MRRLTRFSLPAAYIRSCSYAAGLFKFKVVPEELFPYPSRKLSTDESETIQGLIEQIRTKDKEFNTMGLRIPIEYGGMGLSHTASALIFEELGANGEVELFSSIEHSGLSTYLVMMDPLKEIKGKYLTAMSDGTIVMGWAVEEEESGNDISMNSAQATEENGVYYVSGKKICHFAEKATHFLVLAKSETVTTVNGEPQAVKKSTFYACKKGLGVTVKGEEVIFEKVPVESILGVAGEGFKNRMITLFTKEYVYSAVLLGAVKRGLQELCNMVSEPWVEQLAASCTVELYAAEAALYALTVNLDLPTPDSLLEATLVNAFVQRTCSEWLSRIWATSPPSDFLEKCFSSARQILSMMRSVDFLYATAVCCGAEDYGLYFDSVSTLQISQQRLIRSLGAKEKIPISVMDCSSIDAAIVEFGNAVESAYVRNGVTLPNQQFVLNRLGEAASLLYAASAAASRAASCISKRLPTAATEKQIAQVFIQDAAKKAITLSTECRNIGQTADDSYRRIAFGLCEDALHH